MSKQTSSAKSLLDFLRSQAITYAEQNNYAVVENRTFVSNLAQNDELFIQVLVSETEVLYTLGPTFQFDEQFTTSNYTVATRALNHFFQFDASAEAVA